MSVFSKIAGPLSLTLFVFTSTYLSQAVDQTFAPLLQDFGSTGNRPGVHVSAVQADGKILVGGNFTVASGLARSGIARFNADGTPDPSFNAGDIGVAETLFSLTTGGSIDAIKIQPNGQILIGGNFRREVDAPARSIERLNPDGSLDTTFQFVGEIRGVNDIELQPDGKIIIGGGFEVSIVDPSNGQIVQFRYLARLNPDGTFDFSFRPAARQNSNNVVIQPDGKIVAGNASTNSSGAELVRFNADGTTDRVITILDDWVTALEILPDGDFYVAGWFKYVNGVFKKFIVRLNSDGSTDNAFASSVAFINALSFPDLAIQPDGKVIVCGEFSSIQTDPIYYTRWRVARFNTDGSLDQTFVTSTPIAGVVSELSLLPSGEIFIAGAFPLPTNSDFYNNVGRMNPDGSIDTDFNFANVIMEGEGSTILQQPDGKVVVGGTMYYANNLRRRGIVRYNADGTIDAGFVPSTNLGYVNDMELQLDGKILVVNGDSPSTLLRLNADGSQDTGFSAPFVPFSSSINSRTRIGAIELQPDGKIFVGGSLITGSASSPTRSGLVRLNPNGSRDTTFPLVGALGGTINVHDIILLPDGEIIIGGGFTNINNNSNFQYLARINTDGTPDASFSSPSIPGSVIYEVERQSDGKLVFAGNFNQILRVDANGNPDNTFNVPVSDQVEALSVQPDDKILVGGYFISVNSVERRRIARLLPNGAVDTAFDPPGGANNIVYDLFVQPDGGILVGGAFTKLGGQERIGAARLIETAVSISGNVRAPSGRGVAGAVVWVTGPDGFYRSTTTRRFGYYRLDGIPPGGMFEIGVTSRLYQFESRKLRITDALTGVDFLGTPVARRSGRSTEPRRETTLSKP